MGTIWAPELQQALSEASGPKYRMLANAIETAISKDILKAGDKLPPVRDLAYRLSITPGTVARAYTQLTDRGILEAGVGRGTFVAQPGAQPVLDTRTLELDAVVHNEGGDVFEVNLVSPHLPNVGQARFIRSVLSRVAEDPPSGVMHYPGFRTGAAARAAVASYLAPVALGALHSEDIALAHGAQNGIMMVMQAVLSGPKPIILVEELAYPGYRRAAELLRAEVVPVPIDAHGVIPEALEATVKSTGAQILCMSAEVQNPLLFSVPTQRRNEIADVARRTGLHVLEDDTYRLGPVAGPSIRSLVPERGWFVSSLSKSLSPALRLGFVVPPEGHAGALRRVAETGFFGLATPMSDLAALLLTDPRLPVLQHALREQVADYIRAMVNILGSHDLVWREDALFVWLTLPRGWRANAFARAAEEQGVQIRTAEDYADRNSHAPHAIRLAVNAGVSRKSFEAALERLRELLDHPPQEIIV
ncbi:PLP-dependent aminotransferase family protein [Tropicimonas sp. S265A]|uniref:aminotransferase-like domain-containing protein n=1 Tax=Tropicimonas sp. S265A TaxID=3415134 RepID=UPI003C7B1D23